MEEAFYFGDENAKLFAILHRPKNGKEKKGVIFCHPFGEEKQYSYRVFVRFARELCKRDFYVLRFDCRGYGDSQDDFEDATVETQIADTRKAIDLMKVQFGIEKITLLGLRLGGTIAALVAEQDSSIEKLILWSPVINGKEYLDDLFRLKRISELTSKGKSVSQQVIIGEIQSNGGCDVVGHYLTKEMFEQLLRIDQTIHISNFRGNVLIVIIKDNYKQGKSYESLSEIYNKRNHICTLKVVEDEVFWNMTSLFDWYFPVNLYKETLEWITRC